MKSITVIPARKTAKGVPLASQQKLKVAAYCRVSTDSDEQATSYDAQIKYYTELIQNGNWLASLRTRASLVPIRKSAMSSTA